MKVVVKVNTIKNERVNKIFELIRGIIFTDEPPVLSSSTLKK